MVGSILNAIGDVGYTVIGKLIFFISYVIAMIAAVVIAIESWLVGVALNINTGIYQSQIVQKGFGITLAIANLGFVLGIIIIAIATILQSESYGAKKILWKLVVAAILVNFGLVITAPIVSFSNSMTQYFLNCIDPSAGGCSGNGNGLQSMNDFAANIAGAFNPQKGFIFSLNSINGNNAQLTSIQGAFATTGSSISQMFVPILSLLFVGASLTAFVVTLGAFIVMLLVRYVWLAMLLLFMPFAWVAWVFPNLKKHWSNWWSNFIKWTFFPPIVVFFMWLALATTASMASTTNGSQSFSTYMSNSNPVWASISGFFTGLFSPIIQNLLNQTVLIALMIGGLFAAQKLSITFADAGMKAAAATGRAAQGYAWKKTKQGAARLVPKQLKENLQAGRARFIPNRLQVATGVGLENVERAGKGDIVAQEAKKAEALAKSPEQFARMLSVEPGSFGRGGMTRERQMAMLSQLAKDEELQKEVGKQGNKVAGKEMQQFLKDNETEFKNLQQGKLHETLKDKYGLTPLELAEKNQEFVKPVMELGRKNDLNEIQGIQFAKKNGAAVSSSEQQKLDDYEKQKKDLQYAADNGERMSDGEKQLLADMKAMESSSGDYMSAEEKETYRKAKDSYDENNNKLKKWVTKNPDVAADTFQDHDKARAKLIEEGKPVPLSFEPESVRRVQEAILSAMAEGFSPQNAKGLVDAIGKKNNLQYFERAMDNADSKTAERIKELAKSNKPLANWIKKNAGRNVVDLNKMFGIKAEKQGRRRRDEDEDEDET